MADGGASVDLASRTDKSFGRALYENPFSIIVEYCTRSTFHTKHRPEKYAEYFQATKQAFQARYPSMVVVGNPEEHFSGRRPFRIEDHLKPLEDVGRPRLGAFEVSVVCNRTGPRIVFSKLESGRWPNAKALVDKAEHVYKGLDNLPRVGGRQDVSAKEERQIQHNPLRLSLKVKRNLRLKEPRTERCWDPPPPLPPPRVRSLRELSHRLYKQSQQSLRADKDPKKIKSFDLAQELAGRGPLTWVVMNYPARQQRH
jgi:hypothetical protein